MAMCHKACEEGGGEVRGSRERSLSQVGHPSVEHCGFGEHCEYTITPKPKGAGLKGLLPTKSFQALRDKNF